MQFRVTDADAGERIDKFLSQNAALSLSRSYIAKLIEEKQVLLNHAPAKPGLRLKAGDEIRLSIPEPTALSVEAEDIPLDIVYEDGDVLLVNKPKGMVVHPAAGHSSGTLVNAVMKHCGGELSSINGVIRPGIVHRIDKDTTGLLLICKNDAAHRKLAAQLKEHSINRRYRAIVCGNLKEDSGTVNAPLGRSKTDRKKQAIRPDGREAITHYQVLERFGAYTLIECRLETGRTHQIRVHMASLGHPLLGDKVYGPKRCPFSLEGQCLHAKLLGFLHPGSGEYLEFSAEDPEYFSKLLSRLRSEHGKGR